MGRWRLGKAVPPRAGTAGRRAGDHRLADGDGSRGPLPRPDTEGDAITARFDCAYHFDAVLYAGFCASPRRATRRAGSKARWLMWHGTPRWAASPLKLADGREVAGDFFVDCSGFASPAAGQDAGRALCGLQPLAARGSRLGRTCGAARQAPDAHTRSTAQEAGWTWRIPLRERCGHGHVFASKYIDEDRAVSSCWRRWTAGAGRARLLRFATGHRAQLWSHNVVGLGLAAGFLEPLESTAIFLVHNALGRLIPLMLQPGAPRQRRRRPSAINRCANTDASGDFIILHYCLTERRDSELWRYMAALELPESLAYKIHAWRETGALVGYDDEGFDRTSWLAVFAGMRHWPKRVSPWMQRGAGGDGVAIPGNGVRHSQASRTACPITIRSCNIVVARAAG